VVAGGASGAARPARNAKPERNACERCGRTLKSYESVSVTNVGLRCYRCFNEETAAMMSVDFDNTPLQPVTVADADGVDHTFGATRLGWRSPMTVTLSAASPGIPIVLERFRSW
jgi:hypothetical protein